MRFILVLILFVSCSSSGDRGSVSIGDKFGAILQAFKSTVSEDFRSAISDNDSIDVSETVNSEDHRDKNESLKMNFRNETNEFVQLLYSQYIKYSNNRYENNDLINAIYFEKKALFLIENHTIAPSNPFAFGIIPDDIEQFIDARKRLLNVSIPAIIHSADAIILADAYIAFDCWLEAFDSHSSVQRSKTCRDRFIDDIRALELTLLNRGFDNVNFNNFSRNRSYTSCETCIKRKNGLNCNAIYFDDGIKMLNQMNYTITKIRYNINKYINPVIVVAHYKTSDPDQKLTSNRMGIVTNILSQSASSTGIAPIVKSASIKLDQKNHNNRRLKNAIVVCTHDATL